MTKEQALTAADAMLIYILKTQPGLMQFTGSSGPSNYGKEAATFCTDFLDTYADWVIKNQKEPSKQ